MLPWDADLAGSLDRLTITSELLRGNPLGDPHERPLWVYMPPGYDDGRADRYPAVYVIQGYTGHVAMWRNRTPFRQPFTETADAVFADGERPAVHRRLRRRVDGVRRLAVRRLARHRAATTPTSATRSCPGSTRATGRSPDRESRAITGKSSGGFGAMITPMLRPDLFGALATHAGDALYEFCYIPEFAKAVRHLRDYDGDIWRWWDDFRVARGVHQGGGRGADHRARVLGLLLARRGRAPGAAVRPGDRRAAARGVAALARLGPGADGRAGTPTRCARCAPSGSTRAPRDEWYLDLGAEAFRAELRRVGLPDDRVHFELFEATHAAIDYRYPLALGWLAHRLAR